MTDPTQGRIESAPLAFLAGGGEMGERTRAFDWSKTPVGPVAGWPQSLKTIVRTMLDSRYAMWLGWGPDFTFFYNDAYAMMTLGPKHPWALGRSAREVWSEIWHDIGPRAEGVIRTGQATWDEGLLLFVERRGFPEESYHTFSYSPVPDDGGGVGGMLCVVTEDTDRTIGERRLKTLRELAARTTDEAKSVEEACQTTARTLAGNPQDVPFVLLYLLDADGKRATLAGAAGVGRGTPASPVAVDLAADDGPWPFRTVAESGRSAAVPDLPARLGRLPGGPWPEPAQQAVVLPMAKPGQARLAGFVVAGVSSRRPLDDGYRGFLDLLAGQVATAVANARAYEEERKRAEALAELDRAKTAFFSNVSHEFRTPLTLMLGPVEDALADAENALPPAQRERVEVVHRNGLRLQRLVNTLLDFSRIEAGRVKAAFEPTDLAAFTADLASNFRSACEKAGLTLTVDCPPLGEPVFVDRQMFEKVVLNLLSNAFKFTFEGGIGVSLRRTGHAAVVRVTDTGTGIPPGEMPRLFERFHRVENARGRTHEGSGIGLALVQELVRLHGGSITAESEIGEGTTFIVSLPLGAAHLPPEQVGGGSPAAVTTGATAFVEEALRWLPDAPPAGREPPTARDPCPSPAQRPGQRPRVLVADDNADMRGYVGRLLGDEYTVEAAGDGAAALEAVRRETPDLILSDVMMPRLDGFGLLKELRADPRTAGVPVILLSARAGEESRVEGMRAGADDYLVKPFSARELLVRVAALLHITRLRREVQEAVRRSEERFRLFMNNSPTTAYIKDAEGRYVFVNRTVERQFARPLAGWVGKTDDDLFPADEARLIRRNDLSVLASRTTAEFEEASTRPDGVRHYLSFKFPLQDRDGGWLLAGMSLDVTEQKRAERQLAEAHEFLNSSLDALSSHIAVLDEGGVILAVNDAWRRFADENQYTGHNYGVGANYLRACEPGGECVEDGMVTGLKDVLAGRLPYFEYEYPCHSPTDRRWFVMRATRFKSPGPVRVVVAHEDVTKRKLAEDALKEVDRRKDEFLATLAHELRNPLAPLRNGLQIMRLSNGEREAVEKARTMMERQLSQMVHLVDDLLDLSRISRGKIELRKERLELARVVQQAVETSRPAIEQAGHDLTITMPPGPVYVDADPTRLAQVFSNILNNAAKYTDRGGRVELAVRREGGEAVVSVRDNGVGIPAHMLPRVFDIFTQVGRNLERSQGGLGIGLSIVRKLVEMHGGTVEVRSEGHGMGSEFTVRLPVVLALAAEREAGDGEGVGPTHRRRILVVDDNRDAAVSLATMLDLMGNQTQTAFDGLEALELAPVFRPDLILLDIGMPRLNGYDTARRLREQSWAKSVTLVALTGWGQEEDRRKSHEAGFDSHLVKPVEPAALEKLLAGLRSETA